MKISGKSKIIGALVGFVAIVIVAFTPPAEKYFDIAKNLDIFATLFREINAFYVDEVDPQPLIHTGIDAMLESLDPYTDYIPEDEAESFSVQTTGQYAGIGVLIGVINGKTVVTQPYEGFPAEMAGLKVGDEIVFVDGKNVRSRPPVEVSEMLKGNRNTEVEVGVARQGTKGELRFKIRREKIKIKNVTYYGMSDNKIGYIRLEDFNPGAGKEVHDAVVDLKSKGANSLILDLRNNPGGLLVEAVNIVSIFIPKGKEVVSTRGKVKDWNKTYNTLNAPVDIEIPLVVMVNGGSASASEIVAGALQDYDRAVLVGHKTFGKGLVQITRQLPYNSQLKVTTAKYYIPSGRCIQALDYTHRSKDGSVHRTADSLKREFKTSGGRSIYDGDGLLPDENLSDMDLAIITKSLVAQGIIFEYASKYCGSHEQPTSISDFKLSDFDYKEFTQWLKDSKFSYESYLDHYTNELITMAKEEKYYDQLKGTIDGLKGQIIESRKSDLIRFQKEISGILEDEIVFHYQLNTGQSAYRLKNNPEILVAKRVLGNKEEFKRTLSPN
ncbi:MAG: S41 family peptidase [Flammeovirgaceae bacterium]|nr:S41 family peptidase [Flammeovirgaceae bacterium]